MRSTTKRPCVRSGALPNSTPIARWLTGAWRCRGGPVLTWGQTGRGGRKIKSDGAPRREKRSDEGDQKAGGVAAEVGAAPRHLRGACPILFGKTRKAGHAPAHASSLHPYA